MTMTPELKAILTQPRTPEELKIPTSLVTDLIFRLLFGEREVSVVRMSEVIRVSSQVLDPLLSEMQLEHLIEVAKTGALGRLSYTYRLTEEGTKRARAAIERSAYIGPAPIDLETYTKGILLQTQQENRIAPSSVTIKAGFLAEFEAIVNWQKEINLLSYELAEHLGHPKQQRELIETLINM